MAFVKAQKTREYFKRFQVKFKRRQETNIDVIAQIVSASINGDRVLAAAFACELPLYGLEVGLTNYAEGNTLSCWSLLYWASSEKMLEMDDEYQGNLEATGEDYSVEPADSRRPFRALLDAGLIRTTSGNCVFGALKDSKQLDAEVDRKYVYGGHVASYMVMLMEDEPEKYQSHFSEYIMKELEADDLEEMYKKVHTAIHADPTVKKYEKQPPKEHRRYNLKKLTYEQRKSKFIESLNALNAAAGLDDEVDEDDE